MMTKTHPLIDRAKREVDSWTSNEPRDLATDVARLCRETLDDGGLPDDSPDWFHLRNAFEIHKGQSIAKSIQKWDHWVRHADVDVSEQEPFIKLGIVTWTVTLLLVKLGMIVDTTPVQDLEIWKQKLIKHLEKDVLLQVSTKKNKKTTDLSR